MIIPHFKLNSNQIYLVHLDKRTFLETRSFEQYYYYHETWQLISELDLGPPSWKHIEFMPITFILLYSVEIVTKLIWIAISRYIIITEWPHWGQSVKLSK